MARYRVRPRLSSCCVAKAPLLIDSASRGIGFEIVRQLLQVSTNFVIATCRNTAGATDLRALKGGAKGTLHIVALNVSSSASIDAVKQPVVDILGYLGLDYLINDAGIVCDHSLRPR